VASRTAQVPVSIWIDAFALVAVAAVCAVVESTIEALHFDHRLTMVGSWLASVLNNSLIVGINVSRRRGG
jgi:hypothetical protein